MIQRYWQQGCWRAIFNELPLLEKTVSDCFKCPRQEIASGRLCFSSNHNLWIAPLVFENPADKSIWCPLWLPATVEQNQLALRNDALPWIPLSQFDVGKSPCLFSDVHQLDDWLKNVYLTEDNQLANYHWQENYSAILLLLNELGNDWQALLASYGYFLVEEAIIQLEKNVPQKDSFLLNQYAKLEDPTPEPLLDSKQWLQHNPLDFLKNNALNIEELNIIIHILTIKEC